MQSVTASKCQVLTDFFANKPVRTLERSRRSMLAPSIPEFATRKGRISVSKILGNRHSIWAIAPLTTFPPSDILGAQVRVKSFVFKMPSA
jgi:hypothetical protein